MGDLDGRWYLELFKIRWGLTINSFIGENFKYSSGFKGARAEKPEWAEYGI